MATETSGREIVGVFREVCQAAGGCFRFEMDRGGRGRGILLMKFGYGGEFVRIRGHVRAGMLLRLELLMGIQKLDGAGYTARTCMCSLIHASARIIGRRG